jgi:hypothetical protein
MRPRSAASDASAAAAVRWWTSLRFGTFRPRIRIPLDPNDRQDDDRRRFLRRIGTAETHDASFVWKFYDVAHQPLSSNLPATGPLPDPHISASSQLSGMQG